MPCVLSDYFDSVKITAADLLKKLQSVTTKAVGNDGMSLDMITSIRDFIAPILTSILKVSLISGVFPIKWEQALVISLPKKHHFIPLYGCSTFFPCLPNSCSYALLFFLELLLIHIIGFVVQSKCK